MLQKKCLNERDYSDFFLIEYTIFPTKKGSNSFLFLFNAVLMKKNELHK